MGVEGLKAWRQRVQQTLDQRQPLAAATHGRSGLPRREAPPDEIEDPRHWLQHSGSAQATGRGGGGMAHRRWRRGLRQDGANRATRLVQDPADRKPGLATSSNALGWPEGADDLAERLLHRLAISDREWHAVKNQASRRAAEQVAAALVQLLSCDDPRRRDSGMGRQQAIDLLENALGWLKGSLSDPGCPSRNR
jgi:hypothetical protein